MKPIYLFSNPFSRMIIITDKELQEEYEGTYQSIEEATKDIDEYYYNYIAYIDKDLAVDDEYDTIDLSKEKLLSEGTEVYWNDPEGETSDLFKVAEFRGSYVLLTNGYSEVECPLYEVEIA